MYLVLCGGAGATYCLDCNSFSAIRSSLLFYKARTFLQRLKKAFVWLLCFFVLALKIVIKGRVYSLPGLQLYLEQVSGKRFDFEVSSNCSVLISPTRDKVIVNHHGRYFHKIAFGGSVDNVINEIGIYDILRDDFYFFVVSEIFDVKKENRGLVHFKMRDKCSHSVCAGTLEDVMAELFCVTKSSNYLYGNYWHSVLLECKNSDICCKNIEYLANKIIKEEGDICYFEGFFHGDFKPWNIEVGKVIKIYDFEESRAAGMPLSDFLNYVIDPLMQDFNLNVVVSAVQDEKFKESCFTYLAAIGCKVRFESLLCAHVLERVLFYKEKEKQMQKDNYLRLFNVVCRYS